MKHALWFVAALLVLSPADGAARPVKWAKIKRIEVPVRAGSAGPNLFTSGDGRVFLSWINARGDAGHALLFSVRLDGEWSPPRTIAQGDDWFVNWADFPSMVVLNDGSLAAHWLQKSGTDTYAYDVRVSHSTDNGGSWSAGVKPHRDGTRTEHGFVSMLPWSDDRVLITWLDGRNFSDDAEEATAEQMTLRAAVMDGDGTLYDETRLDGRVCDCCQTAGVLTSDGALIVYRDRSKDEIRDISIVRLVDGRWTKPAPVHRDGWQINGCPVNGPSIATAGKHVAVAWFTMARAARVNLVFSDNRGRDFGPPAQVDDGNPIGRVGTVSLDDGSVIVSWMESVGEDAEIRVRRLWPGGRREESLTVASSTVARSSGFPVMTSAGTDVILAWTEPGDSPHIRAATLTITD